MRLKDKVAIITGASSGIGKSTALRFAEEGAQVVIVARRMDRLEEVEKEAKDLAGGIYPLEGDVSREEDIDRIVDYCIEKFSKIDILVNNAGVLDNYLSAHDMTDQVWERVMDINLNAPMRLIRKVLPFMIEKGQGNIINTASVGGLYGGRGGMAYVASKHALVGMTKHIGFVYEDKGIRCNAVAPGSINTDIGKKVDSPNNEVLTKLMKGFEVLPVLGEKEDIANVFLFLASDESSFINGSVIKADGGWTAF